MYKKETFRELDKKHDTHLYSGLQGYIMKNGHRSLENLNKKSHHDKVLEIGAGSTPHYHFIEHTYNEYNIVETSDYAINFNKEKNRYIFF